MRQRREVAAGRSTITALDKPGSRVVGCSLGEWDGLETIGFNKPRFVTDTCVKGEGSYLDCQDSPPRTSCPLVVDVYSKVQYGASR